MFGRDCCHTDLNLNKGCGSSQIETIAVRSFQNPKSKIQNGISG
jgi:hypothetical protein